MTPWLKFQVFLRVRFSSQFAESRAPVFGGDIPSVCAMTDQISAKAIRIGVAVFVSSAIVLILLRSKDCFAVDGGFRCLDVYRRQNLFFHGNHHLLYPLNVLVWTRLLSALGFQPGGALEFF